jgi:glutamate/tyrosine decarboxylase-like PLP-dependent enzyme
VTDARVPGDDGRFDWHPEPGLVGFHDEDAARAALERLGSDTWTAALDWLYREAMRRPVAPDAYPELRRRFYGGGGPAPAPEKPATSDEILAEFRERLAPYQFAAQHPGSFSYFTPAALPISIAGEVLAQWINQGVDVWHAGPTSALVEEEVTGWLRDLLGFGPDSWGVLTSGGVMANIMGMTLARDVHLRTLLGLDRPPRGGELDNVRVYASDQTHFSIARAMDILGFPADALRIVPSDERFRLRGPAVEEAVAADRAAGVVPFAIAAVCGSTNTGSVDDTVELADLAEREHLWLHVDAAYGGAARLSPRTAGLVPGLERADSVTVDPHKWFFQAYDIGGLVVRNREDLVRTFHKAPEYYRSTRPEDEPLNWYQYSLEGTRRFRALKLWFSWKHLGTQGFGRLIDHTMDLAAHMTERIAGSDDFEALPSTPDLSIVCFRHVPGGRDRAGEIDPQAMDDYQDRLQRALEVSGRGWVSTTKLRGRTYLRAGLVNHLSTDADVDRVLDTLRGASPEAAREAGIAAGG